MGRQAARVEAPPVAEATEGLKTFAEPTLPPYQAARKRLRELIEAKDRRRQDLAEAQAREDRAQEVYLEAVGDETEAEETMKQAKARALMNGEDWRGGVSITRSQTKLQDAQERMSIAKNVRDEMKALRAQLEQDTQWQDRHIKDAVGDVVRNHPRLPELILEATRARTVYREMSAVMGVLSAFYHPPHVIPRSTPGSVPGWNSIGDDVPFVDPDRARVLRAAIGQMYADPEADFSI